MPFLPFWIISTVSRSSPVLRDLGCRSLRSESRQRRNMIMLHALWAGQRSLNLGRMRLANTRARSLELHLSRARCLAAGTRDNRGYLARDISLITHHWVCRGVAQSGSALALGARGPRFESGRPDHDSEELKPFTVLRKSTNSYKISVKAAPCSPRTPPRVSQNLPPACRC
jgi:hypothetical protein